MRSTAHASNNGSDEQTLVQEPEQEPDWGDFWPKPEWKRMINCSCSQIIFRSLFSTFNIERTQNSCEPVYCLEIKNMRSDIRLFIADSVNPIR